MFIKRPSLALVYWIIFAFGCILFCYLDGKQRLDDLKLTQGLVIDQIPVRTRSRKSSFDVQRPQIRFFAAGTEYIFTDKNTPLAIGTTASIAYPPANPRDAYVYNFKHWIAVGFLVPAFIIACFVFSVIWISGAEYSPERTILPSNQPL